MTTDPTRSRGRRVGTLLLLLVVAAGGAYAGMRWHTTLERWLFPSAAISLADTSKGTAPGQKQLWTCGMHPQVIQDHPGDCPICHMKLTPLLATATTAAPGQERRVKYWWDPMMSPPYISDKPGKSPMGMDLPFNRFAILKVLKIV